MSSEKSFLNLVKLDQILYCNHTFPNDLASNQSDKCNYNPNLVSFCKIQKRFLCDASSHFCKS